MATDPRYVNEVKRIVLSRLKSQRARVYFFGSRALGTEHRFSDIDVAVLPLETLPVALWLDLQERLEESWVPYPVDLVNLEDAPLSLRRRVEREGIPWNG